MCMCVCVCVCVREREREVSEFYLGTDLGRESNKPCSRGGGLYMFC